MSERVPEDKSLLEKYYQIRKSGDFPTPSLIGGLMIGGFLATPACSAIAGEGVGFLSLVPLTLAGGGIAYWYDRRASRRRMRAFIEENPEINKFLSPNTSDQTKS